MSDGTLGLDLRDEKGVCVVGISGRIDGLSAREFENSLLDLIAAGNKKFVLDFSRADHISSAGLRGLLVVVKLLGAKKGSLVVCSLPPAVKEIFELVKFDEIISVFPDVGAAVAKYAKPEETEAPSWD